MPGGTCGNSSGPASCGGSSVKRRSRPRAFPIAATCPALVMGGWAGEAVGGAVVAVVEEKARHRKVPGLRVGSVGDRRDQASGMSPLASMRVLRETTTMRS
ncbi:hypothetical protein SAMN06272771_5929 [Streptomyces sp. Ag82_O1-12]|nr:hypothetical protein SAMN06272771_5929 [Streptomyces sp. Ag82_O1-12]SOD48491.1 hypothetical protein SAMN06272727_5933 [Streptomyces sp. Ag82_G6-1]